MGDVKHCEEDDSDIEDDNVSASGMREVALQALDEALRLYNSEPVPTQAGSNAGSRKEGRVFQAQMRAWLARSGVVVETALGKSSDGRRVDGSASAHERLAYKMLRFKRNPFNRDLFLVVAFNKAFVVYENSVLAELREQAAYLNGLSPFAPIVLLATPDDYRRYFGVETR